MKGLSELAEGLQKAAGIQAMGEGAGTGYRLPCRWIPAPLELLLEGSRVPSRYVSSPSEEGCKELLNATSEPPPGPRVRLLTRAEAFQDPAAAGREMGWAEPEGGGDRSRRVRPVSSKLRPEQPPRREFKPPRDNSGRFYDSGRNPLWRKAWALGVRRAISHGQSAGNSSKLVQLLEGRTRAQRKNSRV